MTKVLIVEDEANFQEQMVGLCKKLGYSHTLAETREEAQKVLDEARGSFDVAIVDVLLPDDPVGGWVITRELKQWNRLTRVICTSAYKDPEEAHLTAIQVLSANAFLPKKGDFIMELETCVRTLAEERDQEKRQEELYTSKEVEARLFQVKDSKKPVFLAGEIGTGKGHHFRKFVEMTGLRPKDVNCAALADGNALLIQLFGALPGFYTGVRDVPGLFELLDSGWLVFLDEIGRLGRMAQGALLKVLEPSAQFQRFPFVDVYKLPDGTDARVVEDEQKKIEKVFGKAVARKYKGYGYNEERSFTGRIVMATNANLSELVENGEFLPDLYTRLFAFTIEIPPLRKRKDEIPGLVDKFVKEDEDAQKKKIKGLSPEALKKLMNHDWRTGNVRELIHTLEAAVLRAAAGDYISEDNLRFFEAPRARARGKD